MRYYRDPRMHSLGNFGFGGTLHATLAPLATSLITLFAYSGHDPRVWLAQTQLAPREHVVVDYGCGVGISTQAIRATGRRVIGLDTSPPMLARARRRLPEVSFEEADVEKWEGRCDAVTCCFLMHEMPQEARLQTLLQASEISNSNVYVLDICPTYDPSPSMEVGEPFLRNYKRWMDSDVQLAGRLSEREVQREVVIPGHVVCWKLLAAQEDDQGGDEQHDDTDDVEVAARP